MPKTLETAVGVATSVVKDIWKTVGNHIQYQEFMHLAIINYSAEKTLKYVDQVQAQNSRKYQTKRDQVQEEQPNPLITDNLLPISADIDENTKTASNKMTQISRISRINNASALKLSKSKQSQIFQQQEKNKKPDAVDLGYKAQEEEAIFKELRRQHQMQLEKQQAERKKKKQKAQIAPKKGGGKEQRLSFDFNGQIVRIKAQNRDNLVNGGMNGETSSNVLKVNPPRKQLPPAKIQYDRKGDKGTKPKKNDVFFTQIRSLFSDATASKGIKMTEGAITIQEKERVIPAKQLKKTISNRRLTKDEYRRVKELTGNIENFELSNKSLERSIRTFEDSSKKQQQEVLSHVRSASETKMSETIFKKKSTITVNDPELLQNLISGPVNQAIEQRQSRKKTPQMEAFEKLDPIDSYNLEYIKKGGSMKGKGSKSVNDLLNTIRLPKLNSTKEEMPRAREKVKDGSDIIRKIRLKFEQKLRL